MGGYGTIGLVLLFSVLLLGAYLALHSHGIKVILDDKDLKRAAMIIRLRNFAACLGLLAISFYFLLIAGLQSLARGSAAYVAREIIATNVLCAGLALLSAAIYLAFISKRPEFNFERSLQKYAVREKLRASIKFRQKPKVRKGDRITRV